MNEKLLPESRYFYTLYRKLKEIATVIPPSIDNLTYLIA